MKNMGGQTDCPIMFSVQVYIRTLFLCKIIVVIVINDFSFSK
jgi:hypothetical protein